LLVTYKHINDYETAKINNRELIRNNHNNNFKFVKGEKVIQYVICVVVLKIVANL